MTLDRRNYLIVSRPSEVLAANIQNANEAKMVLFLIALNIEFGSISHFASYQIREALAKTAYNHKYLGKWATVQDLLECPPNLQGYCEGILLSSNEPEVYGNIVKRSKRFLKRVRSKRYYQATKDTSRVRQKVRKRGYDDKGTLRPDHKWRSAQGYPPPLVPRPDRRNYVIFIGTDEREGHNNQSAAGAFPDERIPEGGGLDEVTSIRQETVFQLS
jgi:hypothetical protein